MKIKVTHVFALALILVASFAFTNVEKEPSEFISIVAKGTRCNNVIVSQTGQEPYKLRLKDECKEQYDYSPVLSMIQKFQSEGWKLKNNNMIKTNYKGNGESINYFLLER